MKTLPALLTTNSTQRCLLRRVLFSAPLVLICFALLQGAHAVSPPPDGAYPGGNTADGSESLYRSTFSSWNTAIGYRALYSNDEGANNTATGAYALYTNSEGVGNTA